ncbi:MAG: ABC transporter permease, partial [Gammaproteobacteria bacterium]|nr:ABC transporter permease [Gammaproteobacteria bacterium]
LYWLNLVGQKGSVGNFLVTMLVREIAPIVTALIVIGRSGTVLLDEVGRFRAEGQVRMLESHGVDPTDFIAVPRCFAMALATYMLTLILLYLALWSGFIAASLSGLTPITLLEFVDAVLSNMTLGDNLLLLVKPLMIGFVVAYIPVWLGLRIESGELAVRQALPRSFVYSLLAVFVIGIIVSVVL